MRVAHDSAGQPAWHPAGRQAAGRAAALASSHGVCWALQGTAHRHGLAMWTGEGRDGGGGVGGMNKRLPLMTSSCRITTTPLTPTTRASLKAHFQPCIIIEKRPLSSHRNIGADQPRRRSSLAAARTSARVMHRLPQASAAVRSARASSAAAASSRPSAAGRRGRPPPARAAARPCTSSSKAGVRWAPEATSAPMTTRVPTKAARNPAADAATVINVNLNSSGRRLPHVDRYGAGRRGGGEKGGE